MPTSSGTINLLARIKGVGNSVDDLHSFLRATVSGQEELSSYVCGFYPPYILNFSLDVDQYTEASGTVWVDIVDYYRTIDIANTYLSIDGTVVSGTLTPITVSGVTASGIAYRMSYNPPDDFLSLSGPTKFLVHVENDWGIWGGIAEEYYYLTFGYKVDFENESNQYLDFGYDSQVVVRILVENEASCTKQSGYAYWFGTIHDLSVPPYTGPDYQSQQESLPASITPIVPGNVYFYGRTMELTIRAKDFSSNEMEPFVLIYRIEEES